MKRFALQAFTLCFLALVVVCAFDGAGVGNSTRSDSHGGGSFCGIMHASIALPTPPCQPTPQVYSDEAVHPLSDFRAIWSLVHAIDHPPRLLGRPL
jgi:hypothetical protein